MKIMNNLKPEVIKILKIKTFIVCDLKENQELMKIAEENEKSVDANEAELVLPRDVLIANGLMFLLKYTASFYEDNYDKLSDARKEDLKKIKKFLKGEENENWV